MDEHYPTDALKDEPDAHRERQRRYRERLPRAGLLCHRAASPEELKNRIYETKDFLDELRRTWIDHTIHVRRRLRLIAAVVLITLGVSLAGLQQGWWVKRGLTRVEQALIEGFQGIATELRARAGEDEQARLSILFAELEKNTASPTASCARTTRVRPAAGGRRSHPCLSTRPGRLRPEDLYFRLASFIIRTPALRDHSEDIPPLANFFWSHITGSAKARLPGKLVAELAAYRWPGNARELKSVLINVHTLFGNERANAASFRTVMRMQKGG